MFYNVKNLAKFSIPVMSALLILTGCGDETDSSSNYPEQNINVLQGFDPGGGSDQLAQITQPVFEEHLGVTFNNEYVPGAAGAVAWTRLANQENNDGYTISITNSPMLMTNYITSDDIDYTLEDFEPVANIVTDPAVLVVSGDSDFDTYEDLENHLNEDPGSLNFSNSGVGGDDFFANIRWMSETGLENELIPYDGDGPSWQAVANGEVDGSFNNMGTVSPQIQEGNLKALVVFTEERLESLPDVPTAQELGIDIVTGSSRGYSAPGGTPEEVKEQLIDAVSQLEDNEGFQEDLENLSLEEDIMVGEEYEEFLNEEEEIHRELWEEIGSEYE